jgi:hypothetical protein
MVDQGFIDCRDLIYQTLVMKFLGMAIGLMSGGVDESNPYQRIENKGERRPE